MKWSKRRNFRSTLVEFISNLLDEEAIQKTLSLMVGSDNKVFPMFVLGN